MYILANLFSFNQYYQTHYYIIVRDKVSWLYFLVLFFFSYTHVVSFGTDQDALHQE